MNTKLSRHARLLAGIGAGAVLLGLAATACDSSPAAAPTQSPAPSHTTTSSPAPTTTTTTTAPAPVGAGDSTSAPRSTTTSPKPAPVPTLGVADWRPSTTGYGAVRPSVIDNNGDPTGRVFNVRWQSWGGPTAIGTGTGYNPTGKGTIAQSVENQATVEAFDLGDCNGKLMYRAIEWYFPSDGDKFDPSSYINICTGQYVGTH